jgi:thiamine pyrophosphate-dependent acetolactate synthase large subunit-like protein
MRMKNSPDTSCSGKFRDQRVGQEICPTPVDRGQWFDQIAQAKVDWLAQLDQANDPNQMTPHRAIRELHRALPRETIIVCGPGTPTPYLAAEGFDLRVLDVQTPNEIGLAIQRALSYGAPCFIELVTLGEHELMRPVAEWQRMAMEAA